MLSSLYRWILALCVCMGWSFIPLDVYAEGRTVSTDSPKKRSISAVQKKSKRAQSQSSSKASKPTEQDAIVIVAPPTRRAHSKSSAPIYRLRTIQVRKPVDVDTLAARRDPSGFVSVIRLRDRIRKVRDVGDIVREHAGVHIRALGGMGSATSLSIRGSSSSQVHVFLDGIPLNHGGSASINLSDLPVDALREITLYRGFVPAHLGGSMGGAIALSTHLPPGYRTLRAAFSVGSFRTTKVNGFYAQRIGRWQIAWAANYLHNGGDFSYFDDRGTPLNTNDDWKDARRLNNTLHSAFNLLSVKVQLHPKLQMQWVHLGSIRANGIPGIGAFRSLSAHSRTMQSILQTALKWRQWPTVRVRGETQLYWIAQSGMFSDLEGEIALGRQHLEHVTHVLGWKCYALWLPWSALSISASSHLRRESYTPNDRLQPGGSPAESFRWSWTPVLQALLSVLDERLTAVAAGRLEWVHNGSSVEDSSRSKTRVWPVGRLGVKWMPYSFLALQSNVGRYVRQPTFIELFGNRGATVGNPGLRAESGWMWDLGAVLSWKKIKWIQSIRLESVFFWAQSHHLIRWVQNSQRTMLAVNIDAARRLGIELRFKTQLTPMFLIQAEWTFLQAINQSTTPFERGKRLPGRPDHSLFVRAEWKLPWLRLFYAYRFASSNVLDRANLRELSARHWHDVGVLFRPSVWLRSWMHKPFWKGLTLSLSIRNLLDNRIEYVPLRPPLPRLKSIPQAVSDFSGYPLPGRSVYLTVEWNV